MMILAIDMGRSKSVSCIYVAETAEHQFETVATEPQAFHDLILKHNPDVVVIEICPAAGWVSDLCLALGKELVVANTSDEPWRWRKVKRKSDRDDALKLARLQALKQIGRVYMPAKGVRQWRALIQYRHSLLGESTSIRNRVRAILDGVALKLPAGSKAFSAAAREQWRQELCQELKDCGMEDLWKGIVEIELRRLEEVEKHVAETEAKLAEIAKADERVKRVKEVPAVGERTAELVVAMIDDAKRFRRGKQVSNYAGMTPKKYQSGNMDRDGRISRGGSGLLRAMLVQASWIGVAVRKVPWMKEVYERVRRGSLTRKKQAIIAVARHLLVRIWAMLRDGTDWQDGKAAVQAA